MLSAADRDGFLRNGFLVRRAFVGDELERLRALAGALRERVERDLPEGTRFAPGIDALLPDSEQPPAKQLVDRAGRAWLGRCTWGVNEITRPGFHDARFIDALTNPVIAETLHGLLDQPRAWGQKLLWAPRAIDYQLHWHRDIGFAFDPLLAFKPTANDHVQFNGALYAESAFRVVPGSHRRALTDAEQAALTRDRRGPMPGEIVVELSPGDILFMDAHALHRGESRAGAPRLTLHYSFQAQWVPLKPWGRAEDFAFITSEAFIAGLHPDARSHYQRLRTAVRTPAPYDYLVEQARRAGWTPPAGWTMPGA